MNPIKLMEVLRVLTLNEQLLDGGADASSFVPVGWESLDECQLDLFDAHFEVLITKYIKAA